MSEETQESTPDRYVIEAAFGWLYIVDSQTDFKVQSFPWTQWDCAWQRLAVLNRRAALGMTDPTSEPLTQHGLINPEALAGFAEGAEAFRAALSPQKFLTHTLPAKAAEQRSETLSRLLVEAWDVVDQSLSLLKQDAEILSRATTVVAKLEQELAALNAASPQVSVEGSALSKPQPY